MFSWKSDEFGRVVRAKARLVARGFGQRAGIDFFETFSPCPSVISIRLLAAIACALDWELWHYDVTQAFVQSTLEEDVYARLPKGCGSLSGRVVKLVRSLYGLKQSSRTWHHHLVRGMVGLGFEQCETDPCMFRMVESSDVTMLVVVHVDDVFSIGTKDKCVKFGADLNGYVPTTDLGELRWYAGLRFERDRLYGTIKISQQAVAESVVAKFGVTSNRDTPMSMGLKLEEFDPDEPNVTEPFRSIVGHLMWLANNTRPDIYNAVRAVARYSNAPKWVHWTAALHILMYVRGTSSFGITFQRGYSMESVLYVDSDFASNPADRRSVSGALVMFAGACVAYLTQTQGTVAMSSSEAEYQAMAAGMKECIFVRGLYRFAFRKRVGTTTVCEDNMGALRLANNPRTTPNSKHIDIRHHFIRERVARGEFKIVHVPSHLQHADFLTKPLPREAFCVHRNFAMNIS